MSHYRNVENIPIILVGTQGKLILRACYFGLRHVRQKCKEILISNFLPFRTREKERGSQCQETLLT